jgi:hypothetical protein
MYGTPSSAFMTSGKVSFYERKIALAYRYGAHLRTGT